ncbi:hypothetical protein G9A89_005121 [Geosiphon pyriformis]|nr:hypothetical protein G9A89_005121 [Geosiphon pyriformis]
MTDDTEQEVANTYIRSQSTSSDKPSSDSTDGKTKSPEQYKNYKELWQAKKLRIISLMSDMAPHAFMAVACAYGTRYSHVHKIAPTVGIAAFSAGYTSAWLVFSFTSYLIYTDRPRTGSLIALAASIGLLGSTLPQVYTLGHSYYVSLASLAGLNTLHNVLKTYQLELGKPTPWQIRRE